MLDWVKNNPVREGSGWEPYPISLRVVNWIKFLSKIDTFDSQRRQELNVSLFIQSRFLFKHLEYHLLGNHLFKNAVALLFAGAYFEGREALNWRTKGRQIFMQQIQEQILPDGGHFERSPMYHVLLLEDILDCLNLQQTHTFLTNQEMEVVCQKAKAMLDFLLDIVHQDGEIPFFNDCAFKIAPSTSSVVQYAKSLKIDIIQQGNPEHPVSVPTIIEKADFGLYILNNQSSRMILDAGVIGPDYLPGHAHCDTLSYELSIAGQRCIVNSGTYQYAGDLRNHFRATKAHNTVQIDSLEQHEIWSTFRVARRGYPELVNIYRDPVCINITASIAGYKNTTTQTKHERTIQCHPDAWLITDVIHGSGHHLVESFIHFHPDVVISLESDKVAVGRINQLSFRIVARDDAVFSLGEGFYAPEFGTKQKNMDLTIRKQGMCPIVLSYQIQLN